jgi:hypothetical protein
MHIYLPRMFPGVAVNTPTFQTHSNYLPRTLGIFPIWLFNRVKLRPGDLNLSLQMEL